MRKSRRKPKLGLPNVIQWDPRHQLRFSDAVEKVCALVGQMEVVISQLCDLINTVHAERFAARSGAAKKAQQTRKARLAEAAAALGSETEHFQEGNGSDPVIQPIGCQTDSSAELAAIAGKEVGS